MMSIKHQLLSNSIRDRDWRPYILFSLSVILCGCGNGASFNAPLPIAPRAGPAASSSLQLCGHSYPPIGPQFIGLALSGGGARAAVFSAATLFELRDLGLIDKIDVISAASGGALTAAYYAVTCDDPDRPQCKNALDTSKKINRRPWQRDPVYSRLSGYFAVRAILSRFWPVNLFRTTFTAYDNTDIFAEVLSDSLYDAPYLGNNFTFADINPTRPILIINATNFTEPRERSIFTFTQWDFDRLNSDLCTFDVGRAVAASSAYPALFNYTTLANYKDRKYNTNGEPVATSYVHLFDAGASDNLAVIGMVRAIDELHVPTTTRATIFVIDAQNGFLGRTDKKSDPRTPLDHLLDRNFYDVYDTLMESNYATIFSRLVNDLMRRGFINKINLDIYHVALKALDPGFKGYGDAQVFVRDANYEMATYDERAGLLAAVNKIDTGYGLEGPEIRCLAASAHVLVGDLLPELRSRFPELRRPDNSAFAKDLDACLSADRATTASSSARLQ